MDREPYLLADEFGFENIEGRCGMCDAHVVINRATDLDNASWASGMEVACPKCQEQIKISGETGNHPVDLFWMQESYILFLQRRYMQAAMVLGQAVELALGLCASKVFVHEPIACDSGAAEEDKTQLEAAFEKKILALPLGALRRLLAVAAVAKTCPASVTEAIAAVNRAKRELPDKDPSPAEVTAIGDEKIREAVYALLSSSIVELRNAVAHRLYRPTQQQIDDMREDVRRVIGLTMTAFEVTPQGGQLVVGPPAG